MFGQCAAINDYISRVRHSCSHSLPTTQWSIGDSKLTTTVLPSSSRCVTFPSSSRRRHIMRSGGSTKLLLRFTLLSSLVLAATAQPLHDEVAKGPANLDTSVTASSHGGLPSITSDHDDQAVDELGTYSVSLDTPVIPSGQDGLPSTTSEGDDQVALIRKRRSWVKTKPIYCKGTHCHGWGSGWKRDPYKPKYLLRQSEKNDPKNVGIGRRNRNDGSEIHIPNRSGSNTLYDLEPATYIANPKPAPHPKRGSRGAIRKIE